MKTLADTNAELVKKLAYLTEKFAVALKGKGRGERKRLPKSITAGQREKNAITLQKTTGSKKRDKKTRPPQIIKREEKTDKHAVVV